MLGIRATIVMPKDAPKPKRDRTAAFGAEVVLYDRDKGEDREVIARAIAAERGAARERGRPRRHGAEARYRRGAEFRRRSHGGHCAGGESARAGGENLHRR